MIVNSKIKLAIVFEQHVTLVKFTRQVDLGMAQVQGSALPPSYMYCNHTKLQMRTESDVMSSEGFVFCLLKPGNMLESIACCLL